MKKCFQKVGRGIHCHKTNMVSSIYSVPRYLGSETNLTSLYGFCRGPVVFARAVLDTPRWHIIYAKWNSETICKKKVGFSSKISGRKIMSKIIFEVENPRNFSKGESMKSWNFKNLFSLIPLWKNFGDFRSRKLFLTYVFRPEFFDENPTFFLQIVSEFHLA